MAVSKKMDLEEAKEHLSKYIQWRDDVTKTPEERAMFTNMVKGWENKVARIEQESTERREKRLQKKVEAKGYNYADWLTWATSLYPITNEPANSFTVKSFARNWKTNEHLHVYTYNTKVEALEKIDQLITQKEHDRARGHASGKNDMKD